MYGVEIVIGFSYNNLAQIIIIIKQIEMELKCFC